MLYRLTLFTLLLAAAVLAPASVARAAVGGDDAPAWLRQAAGATTPSYDKKVKAVVLLKDVNAAVSADGRITTTTNYAVRILSREGRSEARAGEAYLTESGKVRELRAWLIRPNGDVKSYGKDQTLDMALNPDDVYGEYRLRAISAGDDVYDPGTVFGYQAVVEERTNHPAGLLLLSGRPARARLALLRDRALGLARGRRHLQPREAGADDLGLDLHLGDARPAARR